MADDIVNGVPMPESTKLVGVADKSQPIGEFLEWLSSEKGYLLAEHVLFDGHDRETLVVVRVNTEQLLADFFDIDLKKVEAERRQLLESLQNG